MVNGISPRRRSFWLPAFAE